MFEIEQTTGLCMARKMPTTWSMRRLAFPRQDAGANGLGTGTAMARVLLVGDDVDVRSLMEQIMRSEGHLLATSETAANALARLRAEPFDLVVTDLNLADGSGLRVAESAKEKGVKALVVTGGDPSPKPGSPATDDYLLKPLGATALFEAIGRRLPQGDGQRANRGATHRRQVAPPRTDGPANSAASCSGIATSAAERDRQHAKRSAVSTLSNRNVMVAGRRTSMRLEPSMWDALRQVCGRESKTLNQLVTEVDRERSESSLTAAIRVYLLLYFCAAATDEGHRLAGHRVPHAMPTQAAHGSP